MEKARELSKSAGESLTDFKNSVAETILPAGLNFAEYNGLVVSLAFVGGFMVCLAMFAICIPGM